MAFKKALEFPEGIKVEYWKIASMIINWHTKQANFLLFGWIDEKARREGKLPIKTRQINFGVIRKTQESNFDFSMDENIVKKAYTKIRSTVKDFKDAEDC